MKKIVSKLKLAWKRLKLAWTRFRRKMLMKLRFVLANRRLGRCEVGGFVVVFRRFCMDIKSLSGNFSMRVTASKYPVLYLYNCFCKGKTEDIHAYCSTVYALQALVLSDSTLFGDVTEALAGYYNRVESGAKQEAEADDADWDDNLDLEIVKRILTSK